MEMNSFIKGDRLIVEVPRVTKELLKKIRRLSVESTGKKWNTKTKSLSFNAESYPLVAPVLGIDIQDAFISWNEKRKKKRGKYDLKISVKPSVSVIIKQNVSCRVPHEFLDDICSYDLPGAQFSDSYKDGKWDGKIHLYNWPYFPTGLLGRVLQALYTSNIRVGVEYIYEKPARKYDWKIIDNKVPRNYQEEAKRKFIEYSSGVLQLATGAGKTFIACLIIAELGLDTLFLVHTKDLLYQAIEKISSTLGMDVGQIGDGVCDIKPVTVATVQTIGRAIPEIEDMFYDDDEWKDDYDEEDWLVVKNEKKVGDDEKLHAIHEFLNSVQLLVVDECHHVPARMFYEVAMYLNPYYKLGLSATPWRNDGQDLKIEAGIGMTIMKKSASDLIMEGFLIRPTIYFINVPPMEISNRAKYRTVEKLYLTESEVRNDIISQIVKREVIRDGHQVLILVKYKRHGNLLCEKYMPNDIVVQFVHAGTKDRSKMIEKFKEREFPVLIATTLADEGLDVPTLNTVILAGGGKSSTRMLQRIGRVIRLHESCPKCMSINVRIISTKDRCKCNDCQHEWMYGGRKEARVYDFIDRAKYLFEHYLERKKIVETEPEFTIKKLGTKVKR